ncbi:hypothetical protein EYF80_007942 [Liparis tanakae]|uniref:Uncharacterized protein n=1 Tax=Liparis tanakae TaxID=230148 RepID=A0A4Z2IX27_9TELE|nr:hypothetical protein EYF80_007942 [Liparis tanakae]
MLLRSQNRKRFTLLFNDRNSTSSCTVQIPENASISQRPPLCSQPRRLGMRSSRFWLINAQVKALGGGGGPGAGAGKPGWLSVLFTAPFSILSPLSSGPGMKKVFTQK